MPAFLAPLIRAMLVWLVIIAAESLQGAVRHMLLSAETAQALRQISVVLGVIVIFAVTWFFMPWLRIRSTRGALAIGVAWVALTATFEVGVGRLTGVAWEQILVDYDLLRGGLMPLGLLAMGLIPWVVRRLQARGGRARGSPPADGWRKAP